MMKPNRFSRDDRSGEESETTYCVLGGGHLGAAIARRLREDGHTVRTVDESNVPSEPAVLRGNPTDVRVLEEAEVASASTAIVATGSDRRNLLIAQLVRVHFDVPNVVVLANTPERLDLIAGAGHEAVCATSALSDVMVDRA
jgi:Trk K+ transport system NAD-binding subunit